MVEAVEGDDTSYSFLNVLIMIILTDNPSVKIGCSHPCGVLPSLDKAAPTKVGSIPTAGARVY